MTFYESKNHVSCTRDEDIITVNWIAWGSHDIVKDCCDAQLQQVCLGAKYIIVDTTNVVGTLEPQTSVWLGETLFPQYEAVGLKAIITIQSPDALTRLSNRLWNRAGSDFSFEMINTPSMEGALDYIQSVSKE